MTIVAGLIVFALAPAIKAASPPTWEAVKAEVPVGKSVRLEVRLSGGNAVPATMTVTSSRIDMGPDPVRSIVPNAPAKGTVLDKPAVVGMRFSAGDNGLHSAGDIPVISRLIRWSASNIFLVLIAAVFATLAGIYGLSRIPLDAIPDLSDTQVIVYTEYAGQAPQVIEDQVTFPLTTAMLSVPRSRVVRGFSNISTLSPSACPPA